MIQLNLLPDVKLEYIKAQKQSRLLISISILVVIASVGLLIMLFSVNLLQKKHISDLTTDIRRDTAKLKSEKDAEKILTVQNQLNRLTELHSSKPSAMNLMGNLDKITPANVTISNLDINFTEKKVTITGNSNTISNVNQYIDTLNYTTFTTCDNKE